jgi:hypothetical protein
MASHSRRLVDNHRSDNLKSRKELGIFERIYILYNFISKLSNTRLPYNPPILLLFIQISNVRTVGKVIPVLN